MNKKVMILGAVFLLASNILFGQQEWTLKSCMKYAVENAPKSKIQQAENQNTKADYRDAVLNFLPEVSGGISATTNFGRSINPETNTYGNYTNLSNSYSLSAGYAIFDGFSAVNNLKIAKYAKEMGLAAQQQVEDEICLEVIQAYYNVLYYFKMSDLAQHQWNEAQKNLELSVRQEKLGIKSYADVAEFEAEVAAKEFNYVKMQNACANALSVLKKVMYYPTTDSLNIMQDVKLELDVTGSEENIRQITENAKAMMPSLILAQNEIRTSRLDYKTSKWRLLPNIFAYAGYSTGYISTLEGTSQNAPFWTQMQNLQGEYVQLNMNIPIFSGLQRHSNIWRNKNKMKIAEYQYEQKTKELEVEVELAIQDKNSALKEFAQADKRSNAQRIAHQLNANKYDHGIISALELQTSSNLYLTAEAERLNAFFRYKLKKCVVDYYKGVPYLEQ